MSVRMSLAWMIPAQIAAAVFQFASTVVAARFLSPHDMGIYTTAVSVASIITITQLFGVSAFLIREKSLETASINTAFSINLMLCLAISCVIVIVSVALVRFYNQIVMGHILVVLSANSLLAIFEIIPVSLLERAGRFAPIALGNLIKMATAFITSVILLQNDYGVQGLALAIVFSNFFGTLFYVVCGREFVRYRICFHDGSRILSFGLQQLAIQGVNTLAARISDLALASLLGFGAVGLYSRAASINGLMWSNVQMVVGRVMLVDLARQHRDGSDIRGVYLRSVAVMTGILWPAFAGIGLLAASVIQIIYGEKWVSAAPVLVALAISSIILTSLSLTWEIFIIYNETSRQARLEFLRSGLGFTLFLLGSWFSLYAAAATRIIEAAVSIIIYKPHINRITGIPYSEFRRIYIQSTVLMISSSWPAGVFLLAQMSFDPLPIGRTIVSIVAGFSCWSMCITLMRHPLYEECRYFYSKAASMCNRAGD